MRVTEDEIKALMAESMAEAGDVLCDLVTDDKSPMQVMLTLITATAVMAKSMDLPLYDLLEGVGAAYSSLQEGSPHDVQ